MQPWYTVQVIKEGNEHLGRAGKVISVTGEDVVVDLDETETHESGEVTFKSADLKVLGT